jgi:surface antigen
MRSLVVLAALLVALFASSTSPARRAQGLLVIRGYPYASRCPHAGVDDVVDRWGMYACNCTSYVAWALQANGQPIDWFVPGAMNAWNWPHVARLSRLRVDHDPRAGSVAVWPKLAKPFGHVAYVTGVPGPGLVDVAEYNLPGTGGSQTFVFDTRRNVSTAGAVFIHDPRREHD